MKNKNYITLLSLVVLIAAVLLFAACRKTESQIPSDNKDATLGSSNISEASSAVSETSLPDNESSSAQTAPSQAESIESKAPEASLSGSLFIGDSRTVGLMEYSGLENTDFFCSVGMSVYNIHKKPVSVPNVGKVTLTELLSGKSYDKIYIMLGVNELGYKTESTLAKYKELLALIKEKQAEAAVFIEANLHVTKSRSDKDGVVNNASIDSFNNELAKLADGKKVFYINANPVFDDGYGNLSADKSEDGTHLYAKYYAEWSKWIADKTASLVGEG